MPAYLTLVQYRAITTLDGSIVDLCVAKGKDVQRWLDLSSAHIRSRLVKRYLIDWTEVANQPVPDKIIEWLILLVDIPVCKCTGAVPEGRVDDWVREDEKRVNDELKEAADADNGLFELPLRETGPSAVYIGVPHVVASQMPWDYYDRLARERR